MPPLTGLVGMYGPEIARAGLIACQEVNENGGVLGRPLELVIEDDGSLPESAVAAAENLVIRDQCTAIIGNLLSNSRIAIAYRVAEPRKIPYLNFSFYEGSIVSRYFFHFAALPNQQIERMIPYMREKYGPRMFFAGNNYEWPRGSIHAGKVALEGVGGVVVGEEYCSIGVSAELIDSLLDQVAEAAPDVFVPYFAGADQLVLLTRFTERGLKERMAVVMGHYDEVMASNLSPEVREGYYSSNTYFMTVDTAGNRDFLARLSEFPEVTGVWPQGNGILTNFGEGTYICVKAFAKAADRAGSLESEALVDALETIDIQAPQGTVQMNPSHHHSRVNTFLSRCGADGVFSIVKDFGAIDPILPERYRHQAIKQSDTLEEDLRLQARILELMSEAVFIVRVEDKSVVYANAGAERMFSYSVGELLGLQITQFCQAPEGDSKTFFDNVFSTLVRKGDWQGEILRNGKDGSGGNCSMSVFVFTHPIHGEVWLFVATDITERKKAEKALQKSEARLAGILNIAPEAVIAIGEQMNIRLYNEGAERIFGYSADEVLGRPLGILMPERFRENHSKHVQNFERSQDTYLLMNQRQEIAGLRKDGTEFPATASVSKLEIGGEKVFTVVLQDVTERKKAEAEIIASKEEAELANRAKSEFLANMSHELRTPLNSIIGFSDMIMNEIFGSQSNPRYSDYGTAINVSGTHLLKIISDILDISKIEAGEATVEDTEIDVGKVVSDCITMVEGRTEEVGLDVEAHMPDHLPPLRADERQLKQIVINLLSNATKFTPEGGRVTVSARLDDNSGMKISVTDTGIGIAAEDIPKTLKPFGQVADSHIRNQGGTGLGLPICKSLMELHGGSLDIESELGKGTTVTIRFPPERTVQS